MPCGDARGRSRRPAPEAEPPAPEIPPTWPPPARTTRTATPAPVVNAPASSCTPPGRAPLARKAAAPWPRWTVLQQQIDSKTACACRNAEAERLLCRLTGAEPPCTQQQRPATMLILAHLCPGHDVVSRAAIIEIADRTPARLHQPGRRAPRRGRHANKTHLRDYETALAETTVALLHVNPSTYGSSASPPPHDRGTLTASNAAAT